jgi:hypothetical protein
MTFAQCDGMCYRPIVLTLAAIVLHMHSTTDAP